ncbi:MAG: hypothetical protein ACLPKT_06020 [Methylocella sp.]
MNPNHSKVDGKFVSGGDAAAAAGDHQRAQSKPVGPGRQPVRLDTVGSPARKTGYQGSSREETIANRMRVDERHYPTESNASVANKTDLSRPMASVTATPGRFSTKGTTLDPKRNDHINTIMRASGSPSVNRPTAGQMVAAKIITPQ